MQTALNVYFGEFLINPIPLELSLNYCSHRCRYCFANLNSPDRQANMPELMRLLQDYPNRKTLTAQLLQLGYPVVFSNHVDPFSASNFRQALTLIDMFSNLGIPLQFQTRGAFKNDMHIIEQALDMLPGPTVWYVSIAMWDDTLRKKLEPGAPSIQHRLELLDLLREKGHTTVLGLNPCVPEWLPGDDGQKILDAAAERGVHGMWIERLHLTYQQRDAMPQKDQEIMTPILVERSMHRRSRPEDMALIGHLRQYATAIGLEIFSVGQPNRSDFFKPYHDLYPKTFPTLQDLINDFYDRDLTEQLIPFSTFADFFAERFPTGTMPIDAYLGSTAKNLWHTHKVPAQMTYKQLMAIIFQDTRVKQCPARLPAFAFAAQWDPTAPAGWWQLVDPDGLPYLVFDPGTFTDYYTHVDLEELEGEVGLADPDTQQETLDLELDMLEEVIE